ncbi:S-layer homology domain-containing protein [Paenibacillus sp. MBLB4367]|uniref:S-layer homology domain-containing protein n=1 Tax=Paenibacillus sp. MBLB4367 TaxID=3384767 RepID=UPI00390818B4
MHVDKFQVYVQREIPLPQGADASKITTAIVLDQDGTVRHVPTYVTKRDGSAYAVVNSLTNSSYSLIWHPMTFADVEQHWAKDAVNDMASRLVVNGVDERRYQPDAHITRAEFAAVIVRALGLSDRGQTAGFTDVKPGDWYAGAVAKAHEYGIIQGYEDGTFRPLNPITREETMVMIARAMKLVGLRTEIGCEDAAQALTSFADGQSVSEWAKQAAAALVSQELVKGTEAKQLLPLSFISRAETAAVVQRMLIKANLIDINHSKY